MLKLSVRVLLLVMVLGLAVAACGTDDDEDASAGDEPEDTEGGDDGAEGEGEDEGEDADDGEDAGDDAAAETDYPTQDITWTIPYGPGGSVDTQSRELGDLLAEEIDVNVQYQNQEGAGGTVGFQSVIFGEPDGYNVVLAPVSTFVMQPLLNPDVDYTGPDDYDALISTFASRSVIVARADAPWDTVEEYVEDARENPGEISVAVSGTFGLRELKMYALMDEADIELNTIPQTGGAADNIPTLLSGSVDSIATSSTSVIGQVEAGELKVLASTGEGSDPIFPDAPTLRELGYPVADQFGYAPYMVAVPNGMEEADRAVLEEALINAIESDEASAFAEEHGYDMHALHGEELDEFLRQWQDDSREVIEQVEGVDLVQ